MSFRQGTTKRFTNTAPTVSWPANTLEGSFLVCIVARNPATTIVTDLPAPWTLVGANLQTNIGVRLYAFENAPIQESSGDTPDIVQITFSAATFGTLALLELDQAWRGGSAVQDTDFTAFGTGSAPSAGSVDTLTARAMVLGVTAARNLDVQIPHAGTAAIPGITGDGNPDPPAATTLNGNKVSLGLWLPSPDASAPGHYAMAADLTGAVSRDWAGVALAVKDATGGQAPLGFAIADAGADTLVTQLTARGPRTFSLSRSEKSIAWPEALTGAVDQSPVVTIQPADQISDTGATLHCLVDTRGQAGTVVFDYTSVLDTGGLPVFTTSTLPVNVLAAFGGQPVAFAVGGLAAVTTYYVRARVLTSIGTAQSANTTFATNTTPIIDGPPIFTVAIESPSATQTSITADCAVNSNNSTSPSSTVQLQILLGAVWTTFQSSLLSAGTFSYAGVATGLVPGTAYQVRAVAVNPRGTTTSGPITVTTGAATPIPVPSTSPAQSVTSTGATLVGQVAHITPGSAVDCHFEWGTTTAYGNVVAAHHLTTALPDDTQQVTDNLSALLASTTYHYRLVCSRADGIGGVVVSGDQVFTTLAAPAATLPLPTTLAATGISQVGATLIGVLGRLTAESPVTVQLRYGTTTTYSSSGAPQTLTFSSPSSGAVFLGGTFDPLGGTLQLFVDYGTDPDNLASSIAAGQLVGTGLQPYQIIVPSLTPNSILWFRVRAVNASGTSVDAAAPQRIRVPPVTTGAVWHVSTTGSDVSTGADLAHAFATVQKALSVAADGDEIQCHTGTYTTTQTVTQVRGGGLVTVKDAGDGVVTFRKLVCNSCCYINFEGNMRVEASGQAPPDDGSVHGLEIFGSDAAHKAHHLYFAMSQGYKAIGLVGNSVNGPNCIAPRANADDIYFDQPNTSGGGFAVNSFAATTPSSEWPTRWRFNRYDWGANSHTWDPVHIGGANDWAFIGGVTRSPKSLGGYVFSNTGEEHHDASQIQYGTNIRYKWCRTEDVDNPAVTSPGSALLLNDDTGGGGSLISLIKMIACVIASWRGGGWNVVNGSGHKLLQTTIGDGVTGTGDGTHPASAGSTADISVGTAPTALVLRGVLAREQFISGGAPAYTIDKNQWRSSASRAGTNSKSGAATFSSATDLHLANGTQAAATGGPTPADDPDCVLWDIDGRGYGSNPAIGGYASPSVTTPISGGRANGFALAGQVVQVNTAALGLSPSTTYHFALQATRTDGIGGTLLSPDNTFTTSSGPTISPADDPDSDLFDPGSYSGWFGKFFGKSQFGVDPSCYSAATRTMVGSPTGAGADIQVWPTLQAGGRRLVMSTGGVPPDAVCPFKDTGDIPPVTPGAGRLMPDGCMYLVNSKGRCIRTNAEGTDVQDVTGYIVLHGASVVNGSIQSKNPDAVVAGDVSGNMPFAPYNCQLVQRSQYLGADLTTFGSASPVNAGGPSPTTPSQAARCGITIDNTAYLFDFSNCHLLARNCHSYFSGSGDIADATWRLIPSSIAAGSTKTPASGQASITCYLTATPLVKTTLASGYTAGGATMALVDASGLPASGFVALNETQFVVQYTGKSTNTLTGCTLIVGVGTIASGKTVVQAVAQTTAPILAPWTTQKVADAVSALANSGGRANLGVVGLNNSGPWALQFNNGRDTVSNTGVFAASSGTTTAQQACYHVAVTANTLKDQAAANVTFAAAVPIRSPYGTGGHPLALGGSTGTFTRWFNEFRYGDGNKTGKGAREMTVSYFTDCLHPERFSTVSQAGHVDAFQTLGIDPDGNPTGWSNERSGKNAFHAGLIFNAGNTAIFWDTQGGDSEKSVTVDRLLAQGVNKAISLNGPDRQTTQRSYFAQDSAAWYPNRFSANVTDPIDARFDHVDTVVKSNWSGQVQNYASDKWDVGWPDFHDGAGAPTAGMTSTQFKLKILTAFGNTYETAMITFSATLATLQANIQAAVNAIIPAAGTSPDSSLVMPTGAPTGGTKNGWGAGIDFTVLPARTVKVSFQDGVGLVTQSPHARPVSTTWYGQLPSLATHPLANRESLPSSGAYNILNRGANGNGKDGCAQPLPPQAAAGNGSTEVINPTTFVVPVGAVTATSSADLVAKLQGSTPLDIYLPAGAYTNTVPVVYGAPHRLYGANPSTTTLNFGLNLAQLVGAEVHGVTVAPLDAAHAVTDPVSGQLCAITNRGTGSLVAITDVIVTGPVARTVGYGILLNAPADCYLERIVAQHFAIGGVVASDGATLVTRTMRRAFDIDVTDIAHPTAASRGVNLERGIHLQLKALDGVRRLRVRDTGLVGIFLAGALHDTYVLDLDVDNVYGKVPTGWPDAGKEGGVAVVLGPYVGAANPAVGSWKPVYFERYRLGPTIRTGIWCQPFAITVGANPASWANVFDKGWIACTKNAITVPGLVAQAERWGIVFDDGTQFNQLDHTRFEGAFSNALGNAAIRDRGGAWAWGQATGSYVRPVSAGTSTTIYGGTNTGATVAYG